jgi:hypothetical protein
MDPSAPAPSEAGTRAQAPPAQPSYAGIGSRVIPSEVLATMEAIGTRLAARGWTLRTGLSQGADQAFYRGARAGGGSVEVFLPWPGFESDARPEGERDGERLLVLSRPTPAAYELAARFHPGWEGLSEPVRHLLARDGHQVFGTGLLRPVRFLVCWTADGSLDGSGLYSDGTGQALRIAHHHAIEVFNLARPDHLSALTEHVGAG